MRAVRSGLSALVITSMFLLAPSASGASSPPSRARASFPVTVQSAGGKVTIASRPTSIVSLSATATEMLYAIGAGPQVRAVDKYSNYPPNAPITNLDGFSINAEALVKYHPDLVVVSYEPAGFVAQMAKLKIPVLYDPAAPTLAVAYHQYLGLGRATGNYARAVAEVGRLKARIAQIVRTTPHVPAGTTYYYELDPTYYSVTSHTFMGQLLGLLGLSSIADAAGVNTNGGYPQLNAEFIIQANPDYIFLTDGPCCQVTPQSVAARPGWSVLSAVSHGRIVNLNADIASRWGPRIVNLLQEVANAIKKYQG